MRRLALIFFALAAPISVPLASELPTAPFTAVTHAPDCTCRAQGRAFSIGETICLRTPDGERIAECRMALNVTSWGFTERPCPQS